MEFWPPHLYRFRATAIGLSQDTIAAALAQSRASQALGFPAILTLGHLAWHTGTDYLLLRRTIERKEDPYRVFKQRKRSGGFRQICIPTPWLRCVQRWIHENVLLHIRTHPASHAYGPGCTPLACASKHVACKWLIKVDVRQFFESISEVQVYKVYVGCGYSQLVAFELARLSTRCYQRGRSQYASPRWLARRGGWTSIPTYSSRRLGHLPQGAPTSPILSNCVAYPLDVALEAIAWERGLQYTRYSDDIAFSTASRAFSHSKAQEAIREVYSALSKFGLKPHTSKTIVAGPGARKTVLGLLVDSDRPRLSKRFRDLIVLHLYYLRTAGPAAHAEKRGFRSVFALRRHIEGLVNYANTVDEVFGASIGAELSAIDWPL